MKGILKLFTKTFILLILSISIFLPLQANAQSVQCLNLQEGGTCSSGEYTIRYTGVDEFGNRHFNVRKVALGADERYIDSPFLTDYLAAMYKYAVIATTILVTVVIIFAGVLYITSAGNTEQTGRAKKMIGRAITGLVLAVGSYTILWTINPQLVEFGGLKILRIEKMDISEALGPMKTPVANAGVLVLIGSIPKEDYGKKYMESKTPQNIKDKYVTLYYDSAEILFKIDELKSDINKAKDKAAQENKGSTVYVIGYSHGGLPVFKLLQTYQPDYVGLIDPAIPDDWEKSQFPTKTTMIWGSADLIKGFTLKRYEEVSGIIVVGGGRSIKNVEDRFKAVELYFKEWF